MPCFNPIALKEGNPLLDHGKVVPCGCCIGCLKMRRDSWSIRLNEEAKIASCATFLTLTYDEDNIPVNKQLDKKDLQKYWKRVREDSRYKRSGEKLKYYAVGEYGEGKRPHYHGIVFNVDNEVLDENWNKGFTECDEVNEATIHYVTKYITNDEVYPYGYIKPFAVMSKGLGKNYIDTNADYHKSNESFTFIGVGGVKNNLPRYYRDRIFSDVEKKKINTKARQERNRKILKEDATKRGSRKNAIKIKTVQKSKSKKL